MLTSTSHPGARTVAATALALMIGLIGVGAPVNAAGPLIVDLGSAEQFAVLAGGGVTAAGSSVITGNLGSHPLPAVSSILDREVAGTVHRAGAVAERAQQDLAFGYELAALAKPTAAVATGALDDRILSAGVYTVEAGPLGLNGTLTLDGLDDPDAVWIFQAPSDLVMAPDSTVRLVNGGRACNVFWQVTGSATLGSGSTFAGSILAMASVTVESGVTVDGRVLARTARITLADDIIIVPSCPAKSAPPVSQTRTAGSIPASSVALDSTKGRPDGLPTILPILAIVAIAMAAVLGEPRRRGRTFSEGW